MEYLMTVTIKNPKEEKGMDSSIVLKLKATFGYDEKQYGNGYSVAIESDDNRFQNYYDLRYDTSFDKSKKMEWLTEWANNYWSGTNGAYKVHKLSIEQV